MVREGREGKAFGAKEKREMGFGGKGGSRMEFEVREDGGGRQDIEMRGMTERIKIFIEGCSWGGGGVLGCLWRSAVEIKNLGNLWETGDMSALMEK